jgi:hypothetical protein
MTQAPLPGLFGCQAWHAQHDQVIERDGSACAYCDRAGIPLRGLADTRTTELRAAGAVLLEVHHLRYPPPPLRMAELITLCEEHHHEWHAPDLGGLSRTARAELAELAELRSQNWGDS